MKRQVASFTCAACPRGNAGIRRRQRRAWARTRSSGRLPAASPGPLASAMQYKRTRITLSHNRTENNCVIFTSRGCMTYITDGVWCSKLNLCADREICACLVDGSGGLEANGGADAAAEPALAPSRRLEKLCGSHDLLRYTAHVSVRLIT